MKYPFILSLLTAGLLSFSTSVSSAQTRMRMSMSGVFDQEITNSHPDIRIGDTYVFSFEFDDTDMTEAGQLTVRSLFDGELLVNGTPHAFNMPEYLTVQPDMKLPPPNPSESATIMLPSPSSTIPVNSIVMTRTHLVPGPTSAVGESAEFSEIALFDSMDISGTTFSVYGGNSGPLQGRISGPLSTFSITAVPEPGSALLGGAAVLGMMIRRRR